MEVLPGSSQLHVRSGVFQQETAEGGRTVPHQPSHRRRQLPGGRRRQETVTTRH